VDSDDLLDIYIFSNDFIGDFHALFSENNEGVIISFLAQRPRSAWLGTYRYLNNLPYRPQAASHCQTYGALLNWDDEREEMLAIVSMPS